MNEEEIFHEALARTPPAERAAYLEQACGGNPALRASVEALLRANVGASGFLEVPAPARATTVGEPIAEGPGTRSVDQGRTRRDLENTAGAGCGAVQGRPPGHPAA